MPEFPILGILQTYPILAAWNVRCMFLVSGGLQLVCDNLLHLLSLLNFVKLILNFMIFYQLININAIF